MKKTLKQENTHTATFKNPNYYISLLLSKKGIIALVFCGITIIVLMPKIIATTTLFLNWLKTLSLKLLLFSIVAGIITISAVFGYFIVIGLATEWISKDKPNYPQGGLQGLKKGTGYLLNIKKQPQKKKGLFSYFNPFSKS